MKKEKFRKKNSTLAQFRVDIFIFQSRAIDRKWKKKILSTESWSDNSTKSATDL